jgi:hypothetical protein
MSRSARRTWRAGGPPGAESAEWAEWAERAERAAPDDELLRAQAWSYLHELPKGAQTTAEDAGGPVFVRDLPGRTVGVAR